MQPPVDEDQLQQQFAKAESLQEFLATVDEEVKDDVDTVLTHQTDDVGEVTLVGGVHGGEKTGEAVREIIREEQPDHVAIELGPIQYQLFKRIKPPSSTLEPVIGMIEAKKQGAEIHPVDKNRGWMRMMEVKHAPTPTRLYALFDIARKFTTAVAVAGGIGFALAGNLATAFPLIILAFLLLWHWAAPYRNSDPEREYDYALIALITSLDHERRTNPFKKMIDDRRDTHMASKIASLRETGDVVAIVGYNHLDGIMQRIDSEDDEWMKGNFDVYTDKEIGAD